MPYAIDVLHVHNYDYHTTFNHEHTHRIIGVTSLGIHRGHTHVHYYNGVTTLENGHVHFYRGITTPSIYLPGGSHIHYHSGVTTINDGHRHAYAHADFPVHS